MSHIKPAPGACDDPAQGTEPQSHTLKQDYLAMIFRRCVAAIVGAGDVSIQESTLEYVVLLAELRMQELFASLAAIMRIQRRSMPALEDISLFLTSHNINPFDLLGCQKLRHPLRDELDKLQFTFEFEDLTNEAKAFFDTRLDESHSLAPVTNAPLSYAPKWAPALPPMHTYKHTPSYSNKVLDLRSLRAQLVTEGVLAEKALQRLSGERGAESAIDLTSVLALAEKNASQINEKQGKDVDGNTITTDDGNPQSNGYIEIVDSESQKASEEADQSAHPKMKLRLVSKSSNSSGSKPLSLKISLQQPETDTPAGRASSGSAKRPKVDIVELASARHKALRSAGDNVTAVNVEMSDPEADALFKEALKNLAQ